MNMVYAGMNLLWSTQNWMTDLWIDRMKAPLLHIKGITSGTHSAPEKLWLPFHTPKGCQGTVHYMGLKDIVQLRRSPTCTGCSPPICFVSKAQLILHVLPNRSCAGWACISQFILGWTKYIFVYTRPYRDSVCWYACAHLSIYWVKLSISQYILFI